MQILFRIVKVHASALVAVIARVDVKDRVSIAVNIRARVDVRDALEAVRVLVLSVRNNIGLFYH